MARPKKQTVKKIYGTRAVIYLRVSGEKQLRDGYGLEAQKDDCVRYADKMGYEVVQVCIDGAISGTKGVDERSGLQQALLMCVLGQADVFLTYALDRQARDVVLFNQVRSQLKKLGVRFETAKEGRDFTTDESLLEGDIRAVFAAEERRTITRRLYGGRKQRSKVDGLGSGRMPWGYTRSLDGKIEINPDVQPTITYILNQRSHGTTYQTIANYLTEHQHVKSDGGVTWNVGNVQTVEKHEELYRTGVRRWDGVVASEKWPVMFD